METRIETTAENRKDVVKVIEQFIGERSIYLGPPDFKYQVGEFIVERDGTVTTEDSQKAHELRAVLAAHGFCTKEDSTMEYADSTQIKIPLGDADAQTIKNLVFMLHARQFLLNRMTGEERFKVNDALVDLLEISSFDTAEETSAFVMKMEDYGTGFSFEDGCIIFSGFPFSTDGETVKAYSELAAAMVKSAKEHKHIKADEVIEENEKYYMRVWLVRIGFGGKEAKDTRKILLSKLKGHTAFRTSEDAEKWKAAREKAKEVGSCSN